MKADIAIQLIRQLQQTEPDGIEFEVYNPRGIDSSLRPDAQIVEHVVRLAAEHHPQDVIVFITNDKGLPTIMFLACIIHEGLSGSRCVVKTGS